MSPNATSQNPTPGSPQRDAADRHHHVSDHLSSCWWPRSVSPPARKKSISPPPILGSKIDDMSNTLTLKHPRPARTYRWFPRWSNRPVEGDATMRPAAVAGSGHRAKPACGTPCVLQKPEPSVQGDHPRRLPTLDWQLIEPVLAVTPAKGCGRAQHQLQHRQVQGGINQTCEIKGAKTGSLRCGSQHDPAGGCGHGDPDFSDAGRQVW